jgi:hypothetical protein
MAVGLKVENRDKLFIYSFERYYILHKFMLLYKVNNIFFMELDNLIYENPQKWLSSFSKKDFGYMIDNHDRGASGVAYIKNTEILSNFLEFCNYYIKSAVPRSKRSSILNEMEALDKFYKINSNSIQILPTHWPDVTLPSILSNSFDHYNSIFDAAAFGIYFGGLHPYHTKGDIIKHVKNPLSIIDCTLYKYEWREDEKGRKIPYVFNGTTWLRINNLHIHTKKLREFMSFEMLT